MLVKKEALIGGKEEGAKEKKGVPGTNENVTTSQSKSSPTRQFFILLCSTSFKFSCPRKGGPKNKNNSPQLRLPRQLGLRHRTHINNIPTEHPVHVTLGPRAELGSLHDDQRLVDVQPRLVLGVDVGREGVDGGLDVRGDEGGELDVEWVSEHGMGDHGPGEEGRGADTLEIVNSSGSTPPVSRPSFTRRLKAHLGPINNLTRNDQVPRPDFLPQAPNGGERNDSFDSKMLQRCDVRSRGDLGRGDIVRNGVSGDEGDVDLGSRGSEEGCDCDGGGRGSPGLQAASSVSSVGRDGTEGEERTVSTSIVCSIVMLSSLYNPDPPITPKRGGKN